VRAVPRLCEFYPDICLTTEEKARKNLSQGKRNLSQVKKNLGQSTVMFWGIGVNENCWYTGVLLQSPGMAQSAVCQTACHSASLHFVSTTRIVSDGASVAYLPDYNARIFPEAY